MSCLVCGKPARRCAPLTFCDDCKHTKEADEIRRQHKEWFESIMKQRKSALEGNYDE
jgi:hypothetical protein